MSFSLNTCAASSGRSNMPRRAPPPILRFMSKHQLRRLTLCASGWKCTLAFLIGLAAVLMYFRMVSRHTVFPVSVTNQCCICWMLVSVTSRIRCSMFFLSSFVIFRLRPQCINMLAMFLASGSTSLFRTQEGRCVRSFLARPRTTGKQVCDSDKPIGSLYLESQEEMSKTEKGWLRLGDRSEGMG